MNSQKLSPEDLERRAQAYKKYEPRSEEERRLFAELRRQERLAWARKEEFFPQEMEDPDFLGRYRDWVAGEACKAQAADAAKEEAWEREQEDLARKQAQQGQ